MKSLLFVAAVFVVVQVCASLETDEQRARREESPVIATWRRDSDHLRTKRRATAYEEVYWSSRVIPYKIHPTYSRKYKDLITKAMKMWEDRTCIKFRKKQRGDKDYISIEPNRQGLCMAPQGNFGGEGVVLLAKPQCMTTHTVLHELGHVLGMAHEHQHPDRDRYIKVVTKNVKPDARVWMEKLDRNKHNYFGMDFDLDSVMIYTSMLFAKGNDRTILTKDKSLQHRLDNPIKLLSYTDVAIVNKIEKCHELCKRNVKCPKDSYLDKNCKCITPQIYFETYCKNKKDDKYCFEKLATGECEYSLKVAEECTKTCDVCTMYHVPRKRWTGGCENKYYLDEECVKWAKAGHCENSDYRRFMLTWCSKACGTCGVNPDCFDADECQFVPKSDCKPSSYYYEYMRDNCKNYCGKGPKNCKSRKTRRRQ